MSAAALLEQYRPALTGHCYRMLGSVVDAEDAVQEAMLRAWKGIDHFREQSSLKTWLYRIATNVCLDTLSTTNRQRFGCKGSRLVPVEACGGTPAFAQYRDGGAQPWALLMLEIDGDRIRSMTSYLDVETLFPRFGVPMQLTT